MTEQEQKQNKINLWTLPGWEGKEDCNPRDYSMLTLAYLGDAVYELMVRQHMINDDEAKVKKLHQKTIGLVCAETQAALAMAIDSFLTEEEKDVLRRGRNAKGGHLPKNTSAPAYRMATGLESLIGYLYLSQNMFQLEKIFNLLWQWEAQGDIPASFQESKESKEDKPEA